MRVRLYFVSAAYVLTDWPVIQALARAADHGVKVRIYLDAYQLGEHVALSPESGSEVMANATGRPTAPLVLSSDERAYLERQVRRHRVARSLSERCLAQRIRCERAGPNGACVNWGFNQL